MKAITIWQPYPTLLVVGAKQFETRSWYTSYRGPIALHSSKKPVKSVLNTLSQYTISVMCEVIGDRYNLQSLPTGCVVATAELTDCIKITQKFVDTLSTRELMFGDYSIGRYAWVLKNVVALQEPIPATGKQGLWNWAA